MKKKTIKINFKNFWEGFDPKNNFFTNLLRKKYKVEISDKPDYLFYSVYPETSPRKDLSKKGDFIRKISPKLYILLRKIYSQINLLLQGKPLVPEGKFVKIFFGAEYTKPKMDECDWAFSSYFEEEINHPRYMRIPFCILNDYQLKNSGIPPIKKKINFKRIKKEKTKFCNFIYSQEINARNNFFKELNKYKKIDAPGRCMTNSPPIKSDSPKKSRISLNWVQEKIDYLKPYKFTMAFENVSLSGWTTEKLTHPMLVNSIPIYFGDKNVKKEFNTKSFINFHDFENMDKFIEYIIKVDNDDKLYERILKKSWYNSKELPEWFKEESYLKRFKEIFG